MCGGFVLLQIRSIYDLFRYDDSSVTGGCTLLWSCLGELKPAIPHWEKRTLQREICCASHIVADRIHAVYYD